MRARVLLCAALWALGCDEGQPASNPPADLSEGDLAMPASDGGTTHPELPLLTLTQGNGVRALAGGGRTLQLVIGQPLGAAMTSGSQTVEPGLMPQVRVP